MKIINNTNGTVQYLVTPSGTTLSGSEIVASGWVESNGGHADIYLPTVGLKPIVYLKSESPNSEGYVLTKAVDGNSTVTMAITVS